MSKIFYNRFSETGEKTTKMSLDIKLSLTWLNSNDSLFVVNIFVIIIVQTLVNSSMSRKFSYLYR